MLNLLNLPNTSTFNTNQSLEPIEDKNVLDLHKVMEMH